MPPEQTPVIVSAVRTPIGKFGRTLKGFSAPRLGAIVIREALNRAKGIKERDVDEVIMGNVVSAGIGQNPARQATLFAGLPAEVGATTANKVCGSGLKSIMFAAQAIRAGDAECIVAGGMESMSQCPHILKDLRWGLKFGDSKTHDSMLLDGLWDVYNDFHMGVTGEIIAEKYGVTREEADKFSLGSYSKASRAIKEGEFKEEIVPVQIKTPGGGSEVFANDECVRADTTIEGLRMLKPVFKPNGVLTAGNSSQLSDGAAAVVVTSAARAKELKIEPLARIVAYGQAGVKPELVMEAPIPASKAVMKKTGLSIRDLDLVEHNEAYSTASIVVSRELGIPDSKFNVNGGAVALGHPLGCSGARVLTTLIYALRNRNLNRGLATLCLGGGEAVSMILEV
ncbi:MAG: acetyl-CoA C-acetyltransferase [Nitrososphaerota archaeon]|nr:acetyl-CoA C-acetyltransferase [Nitrososphaerota archaeon]